MGQNIEMGGKQTVGIGRNCIVGRRVSWKGRDGGMVYKYPTKL